MAGHIEHLDDRGLLGKARQGDRAAFDELYRRHAVAAWRLALAVTRQPAAAGAAVSAGFAATRAPHGAAADGDSPILTLLRLVRRAAVSEVGEAVARPSAGVLYLDALDPRATLVRQAFDTLPERWRTALWLVDAAGRSIGEAAVVLELPSVQVSSLLGRARLGLQEQMLCVGMPRPSPRDCRRTAELLTGYARDALSPADATRVRHHLDACEACRDRLGALDDVVAILRAAALPLPISLASEASDRWLAAAVPSSSRLALGLPGGLPLPAWAERAFAGAVGTVVALGVAAATMLTSRDGGGVGDLTRPPVAAADPHVNPTGPDWVPHADLPGPASEDATGAGRLAATASAPGAALPRISAPGTSPPAHVSPPLTTPPKASNPPPSTSTGEQAVASVASVAVPGVGGVGIGPDCTGGAALGQSVGCAPAPSDDPVSIGSGTSLPTSGG